MPPHGEAPLVYFPENSMFDCPRHIALRIDTRSCGRMWERARKLPKGCTDTIVKCRGCTIGAANAGKPVEAALMHVAVERICPRCGHGASKFTIDGTICVSCFNRQREALIGANRRGNKPSAALRGVPARWAGALKPRTLSVYVRVQSRAMGMAKRKSIARIVNGVEAALRITRSVTPPSNDQASEPVFAFAYPRSGIARL